MLNEMRRCYRLASARLKRARSLALSATPTAAAPAIGQGLNTVKVDFSLAAGAISAPITLLPNQPVLVIATDTTGGDSGVARVTMLRIPNQILWWNGLESPTCASGGTTITS
jgi:hypothetical protein